MSTEEELGSPREANQYSCLTHYHSLLLHYLFCDRAQGTQPYARAHSAQGCADTQAKVFSLSSSVGKVTQPYTPLYNLPQHKLPFQPTLTVLPM